LFPKKIKTKSLLSSNQIFSQRYSNFFGNKKFSDFEIKIGEDNFPAHKLILSQNSDFFDSYEGNSFTFPKEDEAGSVKNLIKFYYNGIFEYSEESSVILFVLIANKYKTKNFNQFKLPAKLLLNSIVSYVEKDLNNRVNEFDVLCGSVDFKKMEKEDLTKLYAKKKWLQKSSSFLNQIILKDMSDDEESKSSGDKSSDDKDSEDKNSDNASASNEDSDDDSSKKEKKN